MGSKRAQQQGARHNQAAAGHQQRRLQLSPAGKVLLDYSARMLALHDEAFAAVQGGEPTGHFVIGSMYSTAAIHLPDLLARYHRTYPAVNLQVQTAPSGELLEGLLSGRLDAVLVDGPRDRWGRGSVDGDVDAPQPAGARTGNGAPFASAI